MPRSIIVGVFIMSTCPGFVLYTVAVSLVLHLNKQV